VNAREAEMSWRIRLWGIVQGVGLRPLAVRVARSLDLGGTVQNRGALVEIRLDATREQVDTFLKRLEQEKAGPAEFIRRQIERAEEAAPLPRPFAILPSDRLPGTAFPAPDLPVCAACAREIADPADRRFGHPFISCMHCGPRYSIMASLPYDRSATTMDRFPLCPACAAEYGAVTDRRFHAQTIACPDCGPALSWLGRSPGDSGPCAAAPMTAAIEALQAGGIVAVKATGGFHLACDPTSQAAALRLHRLKQRGRKPFAVLFPDLETLAGYAEVSAEERDALLSEARPIVLLGRLRPQIARLAPAVCGNSAYLGAFLPSTPIQILLTQACGPLVMTSANQSDESLIFRDDDMLAFYRRHQGLAGLLTHDRPILGGLDDSVVRIINGRRQFIRRGRGYVPLAIDLAGDRVAQAGGQTAAVADEWTEHPVVLALGGDLKATTALAADGFAWLTQPAGDLARESSLLAWRTQTGHLLHLLDRKPDRISHDLHPGYFSSLAASEWHKPTQAWQHHHAHVASVMAEHHLNGPVIGVAFDGTGFGPDQTVWGGEFLLCEGSRFERVGRLRPVLLPGGDSGMRDAWRCLAGYLMDAGLAGGKSWQGSRWQIIFAALRHRINSVPNSSMGRLFDAVCALLGLSDYNHYEGECGSLLEAKAQAARAAGLAGVPLDFALAREDNGAVWQADARPLLATMAGLCKSRRGNGREALAGQLALGFHEAVCRMIVACCEKIAGESGTRTVALSGGVFQNALLVTLLDEALTQAGFRVYWNEKVPPGDGGISLGQLWLTLSAGPGSVASNRRSSGTGL
jgi:hydrogenase maturation protein HypF